MLKTVRDSLYNKNEKTKLNILLNALIVLVVLVFVAEIYFMINYSGVYVVGDSMNPTLTGAESEEEIGGDYIYINKHAKPDYGDIVVVYHQQSGYIIKRAVAFGGDSVKLIDGRLHIRHKGETEFKPVKEDYAFLGNNPGIAYNTFHDDEDGYLVDDGYFFLLGDNRSESYDSRRLGSLPLSSLDGVVTGWSLNHKSFCTKFHSFFKFQLPGFFKFK